MTNYFY